MRVAEREWRRWGWQGGSLPKQASGKEDRTASMRGGGGGLRGVLQGKGLMGDTLLEDERLEIGTYRGGAGAEVRAGAGAEVKSAGRKPAVGSARAQRV